MQRVRIIYLPKRSSIRNHAHLVLNQFPNRFRAHFTVGPKLQVNQSKNWLQKLWKVALSGVDFIKPKHLHFLLGLKNTLFCNKYLATCCQFKHFCCPFWHLSCPFWHFQCQICIMKLNFENAIIFWRYVVKILALRLLWNWTLKMP